MLIGEATLKTASYGRRLTMLLDDLRAAGCTVWLEGLSLRFDLSSERSDWDEAAKIDRLLSRYSDIVSWLPLSDQPSLASKVASAAVGRGWFRFRRAQPGRA